MAQTCRPQAQPVSPARVTQVPEPPSPTYRSRCRPGTGPAPRTVTQLPEPHCQASTGTAQSRSGPTVDLTGTLRAQLAETSDIGGNQWKPVTCGSSVERVRRIELPYSAWEADVLPLNYTRVGRLRGGSRPCRRRIRRAVTLPEPDRVRSSESRPDGTDQSPTSAASAAARRRPAALASASAILAVTPYEPIITSPRRWRIR